MTLQLLSGSSPAFDWILWDSLVYHHSTTLWCLLHVLIAKHEDNAHGKVCLPVRPSARLSFCLYILSRASWVGSPTNHPGSRQRQDMGPGILWSVNKETCPTTDIFPISVNIGCNRPVSIPKLIPVIGHNRFYLPPKYRLWSLSVDSTQTVIGRLHPRPIPILGRNSFYLSPPRNIGHGRYRPVPTTANFNSGS